MQQERITHLEMPSGKRAKQLAKKLKEYEMRWKLVTEGQSLAYVAPEVFEIFSYYQYCYAILNPLVNDGSLDVLELRDRLFGDEPAADDEKAKFWTYVQIIYNYIESGNSGGDFGNIPLPEVSE